MTTSFSKFVQQLTEAQLNHKTSETINYIRNLRGVIEREASAKRYYYEIDVKDLEREIGQLPQKLGKMFDTIASKLDKVLKIDFHSDWAQGKAIGMGEKYNYYKAFFQGKQIFTIKIGFRFGGTCFFIIENFNQDQKGVDPVNPNAKPNKNQQGIGVGKFGPEGDPTGDFYIGYIKFKNVVGASFSRLDYYGTSIPTLETANQVISQIKPATIKALKKDGKEVKINAFSENQLKSWQNQGVSAETFGNGAGIGKDIAAALKKLKIGEE